MRHRLLCVVYMWVNYDPNSDHVCRYSWHANTRTCTFTKMQRACTMDGDESAQCDIILLLDTQCVCTYSICCCKQELAVLYMWEGRGIMNNRKDFQSRGLQLVVCVYLHRCKMCAE